MAIRASTLRTWDVFAKYLFGGILTAFITMFGYYLQHENDNRTAWNQKQAAQEAKAQSIIALTSKQKDMDVQIAVDMFRALTDSYFKAGTKPDDDELHRRLLLLRLVALNFQDVPIQLRPLFEDLDRQLKRPEDHMALRNIALELASRQAFRLTIGGLYNQIFTVKAGESVPIKELQVTVLIDSVRKESIHAEIVSALALSGKVGPFEVGYFAWPITDNTKLQDFRVSILLLAGGDSEAKIRVIGFHSDLAADRFDVKELTRTLPQFDHSSK